MNLRASILIKVIVIIAIIALVLSAIAPVFFAIPSESVPDFTEDVTEVP